MKVLNGYNTLALIITHSMPIIGVLIGSYIVLWVGLVSTALVWAKMLIEMWYVRRT